MWKPVTVEELEAAIRAGSVDEGPQLDFKAALPSKKANADIAVDVSAMTIDGGALIYGVAEDENGRPTRLTPVPLDGVSERIDQVVRSAIHEVPLIRIHPLRLRDDPARGYLVVSVPMSARAPHQVMIAGKYQYRYYGRGATGNRVLTEPEVARLYERSQQWEFDRRKSLTRLINEAPFVEDRDLAFLHAFIRPVVVDDDRWTRASSDDTKPLIDAMQQAARVANRGLGYDPALAEASIWTRHGADTWRLATNDGRGAQDSVRCDINFDGSATLFCGRAAARLPQPNPAQRGPLAIIEQIVAGNLASFFALMGSFYEASDYVGLVDIGVALTGIKDAVALRVARNFMTSGARYPHEDYLTDLRANVDELEDSRDLTRRILRRFFDALVGTDFDPFG